MNSPRRENYVHTLHACNISYVTQAIVNDFAPLLFLWFQNNYRIRLEDLSLLVLANFWLQMCVAFACAKLADRLSYRVTLVAGQLCSAAGLALLTVLPGLMPSPMAGIFCSVALYAVGGGVVEAVTSPVVEACPFKRKAAAMSLVHSFYCWGQMIVVLGSTLFFRLFGLDNWRILALVWAAVPLADAVYFLFVPMRPLIREGEHGLGLRGLLRLPVFWLMAVMMLCAGAAEHCMNQWASWFAESALNVDKAVGDLAGPCLFALMMGSSRTLYAVFSTRLDLVNCLIASCALSILAYLTAVFAPHPALALAGCALCGWSAGILWAGVFSTASLAIPLGGTAMFALLALPGDFGCGLGPAYVGTVASLCGDKLKAGLLAATVFPALMLGCLLYYKYGWLPHHPSAKPHGSER